MSPRPQQAQEVYKELAGADRPPSAPVGRPDGGRSRRLQPPRPRGGHRRHRDAAVTGPGNIEPQRHRGHKEHQENTRSTAGTIGYVLGHPLLSSVVEAGGSRWMIPTAWFAHTLELPGPAMLPAVAVPLARMDAGRGGGTLGGVAGVCARRAVPPSRRSVRVHSPARGGNGRLHRLPGCRLGRGRRGRTGRRVSESVWELLSTTTPLTASMIRLLVHAGDRPVSSTRCSGAASASRRTSAAPSACRSAGLTPA